MKIIKINEKEYNLENCSEKVLKLAEHLRVSQNNLEEKERLKKVLERARNGYIQDLKQEMLASKSGFDFNEE